MNPLLVFIVSICLFALFAHLLIDLFFGKDEERPIPATHKVIKGETLWGIASLYYPGQHTGRMVFEIKRYNNLSSGKIYPGQIIRLPGGTKS